MTTANAPQPEFVPLARGVAAATVVSVGTGRVDVRVSAASGTERVTAKLTQIAGYRPCEGDRVLVSEDGDQTYVVAVLHPSEPLRQELALEDGTRAVVSNGGIELRDGEDRLLVRYAEGTMRISAPKDLELTAPNGQVRMQAGLDVELSAARDVISTAGRRTEITAAEGQRLELDPKRVHLAASRLHVDTKESRLATAHASVVARHISTTAEKIATNAERYEVVARRVVEKARDVFRTAAGLYEQRAGRQRSLVEGTLSMRSKRTTIVSEKDTAIDGEQVLLG